jgi:signal transduction histidine kinase
MMAMETLWLDVLRANYAAVGYHCTRDASFLREHDEVMQDIALNMKLLRQAAGNDPKRHNLVDSVVMGQVRQLRQRRKLMNAWEDARVSALLGGPRLIDATVARLNDDPNEDPMALHEKELERESLEKQKQIYKTLYNVLFIGAGVSAMLTMMTAALFYRQVYVRLKDIIINIDRMIKRSPLIPAKKSKDELGELEQAILRTAEQIANLEQLRSHNAKLLAKSLLQSLDEIADKLDELKKHGFEEDSRSASTGQDNAEARINSAQSLLDRLRFLLTDLLSIDEIYVARLSLHYRTCSLSDIVSGAVEATSALGRSRRIEVRTNIKDVSVECDSTRIVQVITNLV